MQSKYSQGYLFSRSKPTFLRDADLKSCLVPDAESNTTLFTGTKVIGTIGPTCHDVHTLASMLEAGMVGARVDLSWGRMEYHRESLENLQLAMHKTRRLCCTIVDTQGREITVRRQVKVDETGWPVHEEGISIKAGQKVTLTTRSDAEASSNILPVNYEHFNMMAKPGDTIYVGRYLVSGADSASLYLEVEHIQGTEIVCFAQNDAVLEGLLTVFHAEKSGNDMEMLNEQYMEMLNEQNDLPLFSEEDKMGLQYLSKELDIDFLALSFSRTADDIREARRFLDSIGMAETKILAKVATRQSLINFQDMLNEADGIIINRGSLGLDCPPEKMAMIQKTLIKVCNLVGKPAILTRVVDTMTNTPRPTRAEATDIANGVLDGVDGFLLGAETVRGKYPVETVKTIATICRSAEAVFDHQYHYEHLMEIAQDVHLMDVLVREHYEGGGLYTGGSPGSSDTECNEDDLCKSINSAALSSTGESLNKHILSYGHKSASGMTGGLSAAGIKHNSAEVQPQSKIGASSSSAHSHGHLSRFNRAAAEQRILSTDEKTDSSNIGATVMKEGSINYDATSGRSLLRSARSMARYGMAGSSMGLKDLSSLGDNHHHILSKPSKLESIASAAVRCADKIHASLLIVFTHSGQMAHLVAKYRPPMPILTLVVPHLLVSDHIRWKVAGRLTARQLLLVRGIMPMLSPPTSALSSTTMLTEAIRIAAKKGMLKPHDYVVCVQRMKGDLSLKVMSVDSFGSGINMLEQHSSHENFVEHDVLEQDESNKIHLNGNGDLTYAPLVTESKKSEKPFLVHTLMGSGRATRGSPPLTMERTRV
ncbi:hypothetical protein CEUSTIGMA_g9815.t1 [Chlamydomonas eustigma]|uniref:pyruvate kinase n=1 Tax=Chlamydomonas eustigma TaxID=1157962 RepID=A0A250XH33_9CHLO|nr:hypothetical protein CEUSTIGMA_g9815.t1 [Chlamydomonas eustigma]|eukprot:GAX82387.1 hypothetical protein CEUSTIGMA_g9815.t1 [Chlamydomonas eustigma]